MKMIIAIVQEKYTDALIDKFLDEDIYVTRLSSTGGFFKSGNTTLLLGCEESELDRIYAIFKELTEPEDIHIKEGDFKVSGATIFVVDLEDSKRI
ncbi:cyclic-di-AMP receptor [Peptoniphilus sp. SGI.035]|uniref:cyclic-di-AMP receptor n=1 Tax=unclassified Peptoniphilus TaxID=2637196 RepID=UPI0025DD8C74|nr:cyclic-di-AMP receptor [Peptoniphilus sp.]MCI5642538.1 cyclic-di-AMP receptor [Peptoniphilus sp.]MDD7352844.1 cyclic-di-AMP receptor [Peptoniphilaceae bacterium]MDY3902395.1 cyclic-di-AMP receptor [Peptoniphilus sp.]